MGRDKALLDAGGVPLVRRVAEMVADAAGRVALVGDPARYAGLGYPVVADLFPGCGPLAGIQAALAATAADWNLILACDMPEARPGFLAWLLETAERRDCDCLLPTGPRGVEPLCAVYHRRCEPTIRGALERGVRKVLDGLAGLRVETVPVEEARAFRNINTPEEWLEYRAQTVKTPGDGV
jgi:molybdenum cofactor guanylyltransferase